VTPLQALGIIAAILTITYPEKWLAIAAVLCIGIDVLLPDHTSRTDSTPR
jgi:hypothetical protein